MPPIVQSVIVEVESNFNKRVFEEAKLSIDALDRTIIKLKEDALKLSQADPQFAKLTKEIGELTEERRKLDQTLKDSQANLSSGAKGFGQMSSAASTLKGALAGVGLAFGAIELVNFIKDSVSAAAQLEKTAKAFEAFGVEANKARSLVEKLDNLAATLPFEGEQITEIAKNLIKFNIEADKTPGIIEQLAAVASGAGFSIDALSDAYGRANATGKVFGRDFLQLYKNIPGLVEQIAKNTGKTIDQVVKLGKAGKLSFKDFSEGIKAATSEQGKYSEALANYQKTFEGTQKRLTETLGDLQEAFGGGLIGGTPAKIDEITNALERLIPIAKSAGESIAFVFTQAVDVIFGRADTTLKTKIDDVRKLYDKFILDGINDLSGKIDKSLGESDRINARLGVVKKLSAEEQAEIDKTQEMLKKAREKFLSEQKKFNETVIKEIAGSLVETANKDGLEKEIAKIDNALKNQIDDLTKNLKLLEQEAIKVNKEVSIETYINYDSLVQQYIELARIAKERLIRAEQGTAIIVPLEVKPQALKNDPVADLKKLVTQLNAAITTPEDNKPSFFQKLFNFSEEDKEKINGSLQAFADQSKAAAEIFLDSQLQRTDFLISETETRLSKLLSIQDGGNASQIALEQRRLDRLNEQRRKYLEQQRALDIAQIAANNAVTASESIKTIATAFGKSGNPIVGIAASLALVATIASTIVAVNAQLNSIPKFWEGAERVGDKLRPTFSGRDGHIVRVDGDERFVPTPINKQIPKFVKNRDLPGLISLGLATQHVLNDKNITNEQRETNRLLKENTKILKNNSIRLQLISNNSERLRLERMAR